MAVGLDDLSPATVVVAGGRPPRTPDAPVNPPLVLSSTYAAGGPMVYGRTGNPVWSAFEETLGALEGGTARVFASGMAATSAVTALLPPRPVIVAPRHAYNTTLDLLASMAERGATLRWVDIEETTAVVAAVAGADLVWTESPTNPMLEVADLASIFAAAQAAGALSVCDNTFLTPLLQRPLDLGADIVVHSVTKFLAGHSDVVLGAAVTAPGERGDALLAGLDEHRRRHGAIAGPMEVWLALRGLRTLHVRMERACANAATLAARLRRHPAVTRVRYPGVGAVVAIEVVGDASTADQVAAHTVLWLDATSLGGVESLIERRRRWPLEPTTVPETLLRLSVGIEDVEDLWRDLDSALNSLGPPAVG